MFKSLLMLMPMPITTTAPSTTDTLLPSTMDSAMRPTLPIPSTMVPTTTEASPFTPWARGPLMLRPMLISTTAPMDMDMLLPSMDTTPTPMVPTPMACSTPMDPSPSTPWARGLLMPMLMSFTATMAMLLPMDSAAEPTPRPASPLDTDPSATSSEMHLALANQCAIS